MKQLKIPLTQKSPMTLMTLFVSALVVVLVSGCGGAVNAKIGGTVNGLAGGTSVVLQNNGTDTLTVTANGSFTFNKSVGSNDPYNVVVQTQPTGETCTVTGGTGTVASSGGDVTDITVNCVTGSSSTSAVSVSISGLASGATIVLLDNNTDALSITGNAATAAGGTIVQLFPTPLSVGANYNVTISTQPAGQSCTVASGTGTGQIPTSGSASAAIVTCT